MTDTSLDDRARSLHAWDARIRLLQEVDRLRADEEELRVAWNADSGKRRALQGMVRAVRDLHRRYRGVADVDSCEECSRVSNEHVPYPCATRLAVTEPELATGGVLTGPTYVPGQYGCVIEHPTAAS